MHVALYARVSTSGQNPEVQLDPLRAYAERRSLVVVDEYIDHGHSGSKARRPALDRLTADARLRRFDAVVCVKLDRVFRSVHHLTSLATEFEALGVDLIVTDQSIDTSTPAGRLLFHVLGSMAEFERDLICERTKAGMAAAKKRGSRIGRPRKVVGPDTFKVQKMRESGMSYRAIAADVGCSHRSVQRALDRLHNKGGRDPGSGRG